jgi:hypothetical protein
VHLVGGDHVTDEEIVRSVVPGLGGLPCHCAGFLQDDLVCMQKPRDLHRHGLAPAWDAGNQCHLGHVMGQALARRETPALVSATHARPSVEPVPRIVRASRGGHDGE